MRPNLKIGPTGWKKWRLPPPLLLLLPSYSVVLGSNSSNTSSQPAVATVKFFLRLLLLLLFLFVLLYSSSAAVRGYKGKGAKKGNRMPLRVCARSSLLFSPRSSYMSTWIPSPGLSSFPVHASLLSYHFEEEARKKGKNTLKWNVVIKDRGRDLTSYARPFVLIAPVCCCLRPACLDFFFCLVHRLASKRNSVTTPPPPTPSSPLEPSCVPPPFLERNGNAFALQPHRSRRRRPSPPPPLPMFSPFFQRAHFPASFFFFPFFSIFPPNVFRWSTSID